MPRGRVWAQGMKGRRRPRAAKKAESNGHNGKGGRENLDVRGKARFDPDRQGNRAMAQMLKGGQKIGGFQPLSALL